MVILSENDYLDVKLKSLIADYDSETISNLYQPIIGYAALAVYFTLVNVAKSQSKPESISHNRIFNLMQISNGTFVDARKKLEAIGLINTYIERCGGTRLYHYVIYAPQSPFKFFENVLLFGLLVKALGDEEANRLKTLYHADVTGIDGEDISETFSSVFKPNFNDPIFAKALSENVTMDRLPGRVNIGFDYAKFFDGLSEVSQIVKSAFTKKDLKEIERLSSLYGINEKDAASIVATVFVPVAEKGAHLNYDKLAYAFMNVDKYSKARPLNGETDTPDTHKNALGSKVFLMENASPSHYLSLMQGGTRPVDADLFVINEISKRFNFSNGVINVIVDYVLTKNNNMLVKTMVERIASGIAREGINTATDAMNYIRKIEKTRNAALKSKKVDEEKELKKSNKEKKKELNELMKEIAEIHNR